MLYYEFVQAGRLITTRLKESLMCIHLYIVINKLYPSKFHASISSWIATVWIVNAVTYVSYYTGMLVDNWSTIGKLSQYEHTIQAQEEAPPRGTQGWILKQIMRFWYILRQADLRPQLNSLTKLLVSCIRSSLPRL